MRIELKLMGMLKKKSPVDGVLELPDGGRIAAVLEALDIPAGSVHVFTVNGQLTTDPQRELQNGDELTILPPVGGG